MRLEAIPLPRQAGPAGPATERQTDRLLSAPPKAPEPAPT